MAFVENLRTLNSILSSDYLIESRYDIMFNLSSLNTYSTTASAGVIQIAAVDEIVVGDGFGAVTPIYLSGSAFKFPLKYDTSFVTTTLLGNNTDAFASVEYVDTELSAYDATQDQSNENKFLRRDGDSGPTEPGFILGDGVNKWANIYSDLFTGTATAAYYSDLAEKYTCAEEVEIGDVISVYDGDDDFEVQKSQGTDDIKVIGVVSENPGFIMSSETKGPMVGLKGKLPVKVVGTCKKGDALVPSDIKGVATLKSPTLNNYHQIIGFASESKDTEEVALVNAIIK